MKDFAIAMLPMALFVAGGLAWDHRADLRAGVLERTSEPAPFVQPVPSSVPAGRRAPWTDATAAPASPATVPALPMPTAASPTLPAPPPASTTTAGSATPAVTAVNAPPVRPLLQDDRTLLIDEPQPAEKAGETISAATVTTAPAAQSVPAAPERAAQLRITTSDSRVLAADDETLLPVAIDAIDPAMQRPYLLVSGVPPHITLTHGLEVSPGTWMAFAEDLSRLTLAGLSKGATRVLLSVKLVTADGRVLEEKPLVIDQPPPAAPSVASVEPAKMEPPTPEPEIVAAVPPKTPGVAPPSPRPETVTSSPATVTSIVPRVAPPAPSALGGPLPAAAPAHRAEPAVPVPAPTVYRSTVQTVASAVEKREPAVSEQPAPTPAPAAVPRPRVPSDEELKRADAAFVRGRKMLELGNIAVARPLLEKAASGGVAQAAVLIGRTYDPRWLSSIGAVGSTPDIAKARDWYQKAANLGAGEARGLMAGLGGAR